MDGNDEHHSREGRLIGADGRPQRADVNAEDAAVMSVTDADAVELARAAMTIEAHYSRRRGAERPDLRRVLNPAVLSMIAEVIASARASGRKIGICGQAPSDYPEFAQFRDPPTARAGIPMKHQGERS